jgi:hypothetical protein
LNHKAFFPAVILSAAGLYGQSQSAPLPVSAPDTSLQRFEVGAQMTDLHLNVGCPLCPRPEFALGFTGALNINQYMAVESRFNITPRGVPSIESEFWGGHASEVLIGARGSARGRKWGLFAEAEPGFFSWSSVPTWIVLPSPTSLPVVYQSGRKNSFAIELGGGVEYSPASRLYLRMDLGDLMTWTSDNQLSTFLGTTYPSCPGPCSFRHDQPQATAGAYWDFGKAIVRTPPDIHQAPSHRFFDKLNIALITISLLGQATDAITTQRDDHGQEESDPLSKPFVEQGWPGQIGIGVLDNAAELSVMYGLHRMHHHRIERIVPIGRAAIGGIVGYRNDRKE